MTKLLQKPSGMRGGEFTASRLPVRGLSVPILDGNWRGDIEENRRRRNLLGWQHSPLRTEQRPNQQDSGSQEKTHGFAAIANPLKVGGYYLGIRGTVAVFLACLATFFSLADMTGRFFDSLFPCFTLLMVSLLLGYPL
jgi:hypothetical protein